MNRAVGPGMFFLLLCLAWLLPWNDGWAGKMKCGEQPIRLAFYEYGYLYDKGIGIDQDVVVELIRRSGCAFSTQVMTRARIWADLASGELDMSVSGIRNAERDRFAWFADYLIIKNYALVHGDVTGKVGSAREFLQQPRLQFGVVRSFKHGVDQDGWLDQLRLADRVQENPDVLTIFRKLKDRRVDAMFSQPPVFRKYLRDLEMEQEVEIQDWTPDEKGVPHGLILAKSRFDAVDAEQWRGLLEGMRRDGSLHRIFLRYVSEVEAKRMLEY
ncbi:MAG: amino acid ABC transporter substrate-binding protein [Magnetococcales bacterium]|nr:transporter substrate-binding domain-containing protein [Magnetococcales bacterium]NGZ04811.1 amino acid ABC transporter substrate-binding protein [Magnetococcales bacterium]